MKTNKPIKIHIKSKYISLYQKGYPLILQSALISSKGNIPPGQILHLYTEQEVYLGTGYYGLQNKGIGWVLTRDIHVNIDKQFIKNKLIKALGLRRNFFESDETTAFRVFNGEGDGIGGLIIDYYAGYYMIHYYSEGIYALHHTILSALQELVGFLGIYQKKRFDQSGKYIEENDFIMGTEAPNPLMVKENGVHIATYLNDGAMTGIFLDQRQVRKTLRDSYASQKTVLNTFSYTGAFSIFAALGGAKKTTSVDLANRSLAKTREQFEVNHINPDDHEILVEDVFNFFKFATKKGLSYDIVILDPPSYAKSKDYTFAAEKDYTKLMMEAIAITQINGLIIASTNCSSFNMSKFKSFIQSAFQQTGFDYGIRHEFTLPDDFRTIKTYEEGNYLKVVFLTKKLQKGAVQK